MAGQTPAVPCSFHADQLVLAEPGRALVRAIDRETPAPRRPQVGQAARKGHPRLGGHMERRPQTIHLDKICGRNPRITRATFAADQRSRTLGDLLRMGRLPEAWIAPPEIRELRELTRCRVKLVHLRTSCKDQVHAVLAKLGVPVTCTGIFGVWGSSWLGELRLPQPYAGKLDSLRGIAAYLSTEITLLDTVIADLLEHHDAYHALQQLPGIGKVLAAVIVAEIGDITRFRHPGRLCSWAGLTPRHRESDIKVTRGHITRQGSRLLRWAMAGAIQRQPAGSPIRQRKDAIITRRGKEARNIARVAAARQLLTCVFYTMRDGQARSLATRTAAQDAA